MNTKMQLSKHKGILILTVVYLISRLLFLDSDPHLVESDEIDYKIISQGFLTPGWPIYRDIPYLQQFPLFHFTAAQIHRLTHNWGSYVSMKLLSVFGSLIIGISLYLLGVIYLNKRTGLLSTLTFWLIPLSVFYSRTGTLDMFALGWAVLSFAIFVYSVKLKKPNLTKLSAFLFALSIFSKINSSVFLLSFITFSMFEKERLTKLRLFIQSLIIFLAPVVIIFILTFKSHFTQQMGQLSTFYLQPIFNLKVHLATLLIYVQQSPWLISYPILITILLGIIQHNKKALSQPFTQQIVSIFLPALVFIWAYIYSPRYFLLLTPGIALISGNGLSNLKSKGLPFLLLVSTLPFSYQAWQATTHRSLRTLATEVSTLSNNNPNLPIYITLGEYKASFYLGREARLLSQDVNNTGGIVITDQQITPFFQGLTEAKYVEMNQVLTKINKSQPTKEITDPINHFPRNKQSNTFSLYLIQPNSLDI